MANDLEAELRLAIRNGFLHLSFGKSLDGKVWDCTYRTTDSTNIHRVEHADPIECIKKALRGGTRETKAAMKPKRRDVEDLF